jgi:CspA family cold shock protein
MSLIYRLLICAVVAIPLSGLYSGSLNTAPVIGNIGFALEPVTIGAFFATALICVLLSGFGAGSSNEAGSPNKSNKPRSKSSRSGGRELGSVKWFNGRKGFGFITRDNGEEVFVHFRSVQKNGKRLAPGMEVEFVVSEGNKGPEAIDVEIV